MGPRDRQAGSSRARARRPLVVGRDLSSGGCPCVRSMTAMANISPGSAGRATYMTVATAAVAPTGRLVGSDEEEGHSDMPGPQQDMAPDEKSGDDGELLSALVAHLRDNRSPLRQQWVD